MADHPLNILRPSVNNLSARIFVRAAGLDVEEVDVWGKTAEGEYVEKYPPDLTPTPEDPRRELRDHVLPAQQARARPSVPDGSRPARDGRQRDAVPHGHVLSVPC